MVLPVLAAVGAIAGTALDYFGQRRAQRRQERIFNEIRGISSDQLTVNDDHFRAAFPHLEAAVKTAREFGERALRMNTQAGATASRLVGDQSRGIIRENRADLRRRGLGSTSRLASAAADTQRVAGRTISQIGENVGAQNAEIVQGTGDRVAAGQEGMANAILGKGARDVAIRGRLADTLSGTEVSYEGNVAGSLAEISGMADLLRESWGNTARRPGYSSLGNKVGKPKNYSGKY